MKTYYSAATLGCLAAGVECKGSAWAREPAWGPAQPTPALALMEYHAATAPHPTEAPELHEPLEKRDALDTCGYINGETCATPEQLSDVPAACLLTLSLALDSIVVCPTGGSCFVNSISSVAGCCGRSCALPTACLPKISSRLGSNADPAKTLYWCGHRLQGYKP
jgi:hypothetical protein